MFAETARRDILKLRSDGISPSDADIVELNDLAVEIERGRNTTAVNHPRFAFAGNAVLHEPTVASIEWWWTFGHDACWTSRGQLHVHYFSLAFARKPEVFESLESPSEIRKAVRAWIKGVGATEDELFRAMLWVKHGERVSGDSSGSARVEDPDDELRRVHSILVTAVGQAGLEKDDAERMTMCELVHIIRSSSRAGIEMKPSVARLYMAYIRKLAEIRENGKKGAD